MGGKLLLPKINLRRIEAKSRSKLKFITRPILKKVLIDIFSIWIRTRYADEQGIVKCFTCGRIDYWWEMDCGHWERSNNYGTKWDEENCQVQCTRCNITMSGNYERFAEHLQTRYGNDILLKLKIKSQNKSKIYDYELKTLIQVFYEKCQTRYHVPRVEEKVREVIKRFIHAGGVLGKGTVSLQ